MNAEILCVGTELLLGDTVNTNASYIAKELANCGIGCYYHTVVGDNPERLKTCLEHALSRSDLVVMTGGLGPTYDDLTKETVAGYFGLPMELHRPSLEAMQRFYDKIGRDMPPTNEKQAMMPRGATVLANDRGTAPGLAVEQDGKTVIMMPGPPREMTAMFEKQVRPFLLERSSTLLVSHNIHLFGIGESALEYELRERMQRSENPTIAPYAKEGEVLLRITAGAGRAEAAEALIRPVLDEICAQYKQHVYGVDVGTLENALSLELRAKGKTIAVAESCTGGLVGKRLTDLPGASDVFHCGVCTYSNAMKTRILGVPEETLSAHGAVSGETAAAMAKGVRELSGCDFGLSTTGVAGPGGGSAEKPVGLVFVGVSTASGEEVHKLHLSRGYGGERAFIRNYAASHALYLALRAVQNQKSN